MIKYIISVSRRTDIPAFFSEWFINRLKDGFAYYKNPFRNEYVYVSLKSADIIGFVFWSKNFSPLLSKLESIEKISKNLFFHFTITGLPNDIEINVPPPSETLKDLIYLAKRYSYKNVVWRFDPICITNRITFQQHLNNFIYCAERLKGYIQNCYISFVHPYARVLKNFKKYTSHSLIFNTTQERKYYSSILSQIAEQFGIKIFACCNDDIVSGNIMKGSCINLNTLADVWLLRNVPKVKIAPTRTGCACTRSLDIGAYNTCHHGCIYCYANCDKEKALSFINTHNPYSLALDNKFSP
jgi:DNA repair photolyase